LAPGSLVAVCGFKYENALFKTINRVYYIHHSYSILMYESQSYLKLVSTRTGLQAGFLCSF
jgi:hypothetical protein